MEFLTFRSCGTWSQKFSFLFPNLWTEGWIYFRICAKTVKLYKKWNAPKFFQEIVASTNKLINRESTYKLKNGSPSKKRSLVICFNTHLTQTVNHTKWIELRLRQAVLIIAIQNLNRDLNTQQRQNVPPIQYQVITEILVLPSISKLRLIIWYVLLLFSTLVL